MMIVGSIQDDVYDRATYQYPPVGKKPYSETAIQGFRLIGAIDDLTDALPEFDGRRAVFNIADNIVCIAGRWYVASDASMRRLVDLIEEKQARIFRRNDVYVFVFGEPRRS